MADDLIREENKCLKIESTILRDNIRRATNMKNGHKSQSDSTDIARDLQGLLGILEKQRVLISSLEQYLDLSQSDYESLLETSLQDARISSIKSNPRSITAEIIIKEEAIVYELQNEINNRVKSTARTISDMKSAIIHQNAEMNPASLPSKSPTLHKSGARVNELKKNKYLSPLN